MSTEPDFKPGERQHFYNGVTGVTTCYGETWLECRNLIRDTRWYRGVSDIRVDDIGETEGLKFICFHSSSFLNAALEGIARGL